MDKLLKLAENFEKIVFAQKVSAQPADVENALGSLYTNDDPLYAAIDRFVSEGKILLDIYLKVEPTGDVSIILKGNHPKIGAIQSSLKPLAAKMSSTLKTKKVLPAETMMVPGRAPWKTNFGYA